MNSGKKNEMYGSVLTTGDLTGLFGADTKEDAEIINTYYEEQQLRENLKYRIASPDEKEKLIRDIKEKFLSLKTTFSGEHRKKDWEKGWNKNLERFIESDFDLKALRPHYFNKYAPARIDNVFIFPESEMFVYEYYILFLRWVFQKYLLPFENILEFGCGTGINLMLLAEMFPGKYLWGFDWVRTPVEIIKHLNRRFGWNIKGGIFNFFRNDNNIEIPANACVFTVTALEQVGTGYHNFIQLILEQKPKLVINIEPINEFYNENNFLESLSLEYHKRRNYLWNYYTTLKELENEGKIEILKNFHHRFGHIYNHSISYIVWKPGD